MIYHTLFESFFTIRKLMIMVLKFLTGEELSDRSESSFS